MIACGVSSNGLTHAMWPCTGRRARQPWRWPPPRRRTSVASWRPAPRPSIQHVRDRAIVPVPALALLRATAGRSTRTRDQGHASHGPLHSGTLNECDGHPQAPSSFDRRARPPAVLPRGRQRVPVSLFQSKKAWMDKYVYAQWWSTVLLPEVRDFRGGVERSMIMDSASTHDVALKAKDVEISFLSPNVRNIC